MLSEMQSIYFLWFKKHSFLSC